MKDRQTEVNKVYIPYVEKHLGKNPLQNILVTGGRNDAYNVELDRHSNFTYENMFFYELIDNKIENIMYKWDKTIKDNILNPEVPIQSVNLIFADVGGGNECNTIIWGADKEQGVKKILDSGFINNHYDKLVFVYFDGMLDIDCFLDKEYDGYKSEDFFSREIEWYDEWNDANYSQRLEGVVFSV
jgi:hypothetical protein